MRYRVWLTGVSMSVVLSSMLLAAPFAALAQENAPAKAKQPSCPMCEKHADNKSMHQEMETMHQGMTRELEQQLTTLRDHAKAMEGVSDQTQMLVEMKKHQQMTDTLLGTMIEQHQKMHAVMHEHHKGMHGTMHHKHEASESGAKPERAE